MQIRFRVYNYVLTLQKTAAAEVAIMKPQEVSCITTGMLQDEILG
jgi:hypothetical protein